MILLLVTACVLGLLSFFEPCTIATHTLYTVRAHKQTSKRCSSLLIVWLSRSILCSSLLVLLVFLLPQPVWTGFTSGIILSIMALLYLVSRRLYIPVPHLKFHLLIPGSEKLSEAIQLGLTLPACTLPLFVIVAGISVSHNSISAALIAGILFATFFTLPMLITSFKGINAQGQDLLQKAANSSPYFTAVLLLGAALFLILPEFDLSPSSFGAVMNKAGMSGLLLSFLVGFVFSFNPVSFASIPVVLAYVTRAHEKKQAIIYGLAFVLGMILTHVVLGVAAALGGEWVKSAMGRQWGLILGPALIVLGLIWAGWLRFSIPGFGMRAKKVSGFWGAFLLGIPFSVAVCPFCTPALLVTLAASSAVGSVVFGFALLLAFALGRSIPIIIGAWSMGWLESLQGISRYQRGLEIIAGLVLVLTGVYLINESFFVMGA